MDTKTALPYRATILPRMNSRLREKRALLEQFETLVRLPQRARDEIVAAASCRAYRRDQVIFKAGATPEVAMFLAHGSVMLATTGVQHRPLAVELVVPPQPFGVLSIASEIPFPLSAIALEPSVVFQIPASLLQELIKKNTEIEHSFMSLAASRFSHALRIIRNLAATSARERIAYALSLILERRYPDTPAPIELPVARRQIASLGGTTVETCIRVIKEFEREGIVRTRHARAVEILDPHALHALARAAA